MLGNIKKLNFDNFSNFELYRIDVIADGSCLLHAIALSYFSEYINIDENKNIVKKRQKIIKRLRKNLADKLEEINPYDDLDRTYYESLGNGSISELGDDIDDYSLEGMKNLLDSDSQLGDEVIGYIQMVLNKSLYFIYEKTGNVFNYNYGDFSQKDSICLFVKEGHYDLIGLEEDGIILTWFDKDHEFVQYLNSKIEDIYLEK